MKIRYHDEEWGVLVLDRDDTPAAREMARLLEWDTKYEIDLQDDLFAYYTICRKQ